MGNTVLVVFLNAHILNCAVGLRTVFGVICN